MFESYRVYVVSENFMVKSEKKCQVVGSRTWKNHWISVIVTLSYNPSFERQAVLWTQVVVSWKTGRGRQSISWQKHMKVFTIGLVHVIPTSIVEFQSTKSTPTIVANTLWYLLTRAVSGWSSYVRNLSFCRPTYHPGEADISLFLALVCLFWVDKTRRQSSKPEHISSRWISSKIEVNWSAFTCENFAFCSRRSCYTCIKFRTQ